MTPKDFFTAIGFTEPLRRWLRSNAGDARRDELLVRLAAAFSDECPRSEVEPISRLVQEIKRKHGIS